MLTKVDHFDSCFELGKSHPLGNGVNADHAGCTFQLGPLGNTLPNGTKALRLEYYKQTQPEGQTSTYPDTNHIAFLDTSVDDSMIASREDV